MILLALLLATPQADRGNDHLILDQRISANTDKAADPYWDCVMQKAVALEPSGDAPSEVVTAAFTSCDDVRLPFHMSIANDFAGKNGLISQGEPMKSYQEALTRFESDLRDEAQLRIVEIRANRKRGLR